MEIFTVKTTAIRNVATTKKKSKTSGVFSIESDEDESSAQISTVSSINSINSLLSLQSLSSEEVALQEALDKGEKQLDSLDEYLKSIALNDPKKQAQALQKMKEKSVDISTIEDQAARDILESIETLAQVELAKQRTKNR